MEALGTVFGENKTMAKVFSKRELGDSD